MAKSHEANELARLRERAYGPGGSLDQASLDRMRDLERAVLVPAAVHIETVDTIEATPLPGSQNLHTRSTSHKRIGWVVGIGIVLILVSASVGYAIGNGLMGGSERPWATTPIDPESLPPQFQEARLRILPVASWDERSLTLLGAVDSLTVWAGTTENGEMTCVVIDVGVAAEPSCAPRDDMRADGHRGSIILESGDPNASPRQVTYDVNPYVYPQATFTIE